MNLRQIDYFIAICEERNFTRAANKCGVRQPSLTGAMQRLERELGGDLFVRTMPVELTVLGTALRPHFVRIAKAVAAAQQCAAAKRSQLHGDDQHMRSVGVNRPDRDAPAEAAGTPRPLEA
jgi:DNA-binding transcriptional LysR family regulator